MGGATLRPVRSTFTLVVRPDGRAILTTPDGIPPQAALDVQQAIADWKAGLVDPLIIADCDVVQVVDVDLAEVLRPVPGLGSRAVG